MIKQNKTADYLKYAIGEIILVMIGILLALQVSNWNTNKKRHQLEKVLLAQVKEEISWIYSDIEGDIIILNLGQRSHERIIDDIQQNVSYVDTMCFDFYWLKADEYIYPKEAVYGKIKEEGLDIIKNDSIKTLLQILYEQHYPRISKDHAFFPDLDIYFTEYFQEHFRPNYDLSLKFSAKHPSGRLNFPKEYVSNGKTRFRTIGDVPLDFEALKKDTKFQMLLEQSQDYRLYKIRRYGQVKDAIDKILPLIDKELANDQIF